MEEQTVRQESQNSEHFMSVADVKVHYESLMSFFKWLVGISFTAIALIAGIGIYFSYQSISDFRSEARAAIDESSKLASTQISK